MAKLKAQRGISEGIHPMDTDQPNSTLNPMALTVVDLARLLSKAGGQPVTVAMLQADLAAGAPSNPDGTINLVHYGAWLAREAARHD